MLAVGAFVHLALATASAVGSAVAPGDGKALDNDSLSLREVGARNTPNWRVWLEKDGHPVSFWHDIPLYPDERDKSIVNFYVEIPRWTDGKMETKRNEPLNPIFHDDRHGRPRFVASVWPHRSYPFLYGSFPQTWESPNVKHPFTGFPGDNDPMDVFDICGLGPGHVGQVKQVKVLGGLAMIDKNTTDWKVMVVDVEDPLSNVVDTVDDLEKYRPGLKKEFYDWFVYYKVARGYPLNDIVGRGYQNATFMRRTIAESHGYWKDLIYGRQPPGKISIHQTSDPDARESYIRSRDAAREFDIPKICDIKHPAKRPKKYDYWYYLDEQFKLIRLPGQEIDVD